jgi:hypothetical protein
MATDAARPRAERFSSPPLLLLVGMAVSAALLITWRSHLTFFIDDWDLLLHRRGLNADVLLDPHARHLIVAPVVLWKAIQATFGMDSQIPFAIASTTAFMSSVALLFVYMRRRVGDWLALAALAPILFMGTAYEDLLNVFQISYFGSMAFGIGALLAFERRDRKGDVVACVLLLASLAFSEIALAFGVGCAVSIALDRGPWRRAWVIAVPAFLYVVWYFGWGRQGPSSLTFTHIANSPVYVLDGFASSMGSLLGFGQPVLSDGSAGLDWGRPLLVAVVGMAVWGLLRTPSRRRTMILVPLSIGLTFWFLTAANAGLGRPPDASRYQYLGAVFILMIAAEYGAAWRPSWRLLLALSAVAVAATISNFSILHESYRRYVAATELVRGGLTGLEIARDTVPADLVLNPENSNFEYFDYVDSASYLSAEREFGSPAYTQMELANAAEGARVAADKVLGAALRLAPEPLGARVAERGCVTVRPARNAPAVLSLPPGGATLDPARGVTATLRLRRFAASSFPISAGTLRGPARLDIPRDRSRRPWLLQVEAAGEVTVCHA